VEISYPSFFDTLERLVAADGGSSGGEDYSG